MYTMPRSNLSRNQNPRSGDGALFSGGGLHCQILLNTTKKVLVVVCYSYQMKKPSFEKSETAKCMET